MTLLVNFNPNHHKRETYGVKVLCRPSFLNTIIFGQVFDSNENVMNFLIDEVVAHTFGTIKFLDFFQELDIILLRINAIPKSFISFEHLFDPS